MTLSGGGDGRARASRTQAEEVDSTIVQKVADMPGVLGHRAESVCTAGCYAFPYSQNVLDVIVHQ